MQNDKRTMKCTIFTGMYQKEKNRTKFDQNDEQMNNGLLPLDVRKSFACHGRASSAKAGKMRKFNRSQVLKKCQSLNISFQSTSQKKIHKHKYTQ